MRHPTATTIAIACALAAGCGAKVGGSDVDAGGGDDAFDAPPRIDSSTSIPDGPPPDALPCTGGNAQATDGASCYEAFLALPQSWLDAEDVCIGRGGHLARIESAIENAMVAALVGANRAYIGGSDLALEGTFMWSDGTPFAGGYTHWRTGEPNNANNNFQEDCAVIEGQNPDPTWDDRPCAPDPLAGVPGQYFYVCER